MRTVRRLSFTSLLVQTLLLLAIAACAIIGVAGLLLPLIPGLLFLALAAVLLRHFQRRQFRM